MNPGLAYLLRTGIRGTWRRALRRMRTFRGLVTTVLGVAFFAGVAGLQVLALMIDPAPPPDPAAAAQAFSLLMMVFLLVQWVSADAPFFWPAEVQFLFPAPLTRRELLLYALLGRGWVQLFSGVWLGLVGMRSAVHPAAALPAVTLAVLFMYAAGMLAGLLKVAARDRIPPAVRKTVLAAAAVAAGMVALAFYRDAQAAGYAAAGRELLRSPGMRVALLPTRPFAEVFAAESLPGALGWSAACAALIGAVGWASLALRVDFRERSLVSSARRFERIQRTRSGRPGLGAGIKPRNRRLRVPSFGFLGPAAPLARRQAYELGRGLRVLLGPLFMAAVVFFYVMIGSLMMDDGDGAPGASLVVLVIVFPLMGAGGLSVDFRRDLERVGYLRSLPLRPAAVAVGQVFVAAAVIGLVNLLLLGIAFRVAGGWVDGRMLALAAAVAVPAAWLAVTLENWLFLLYPTRMQADGGQQSAFMGKQLVKLIFKLFALGLVGVGAGLGALAGGWVAGVAGAAVGGFMVVLLACWAATGLLAHAYAGFDLTLDAPA